MSSADPDQTMSSSPSDFGSHWSCFFYNYVQCYTDNSEQCGPWSNDVVVFLLMLFQISDACIRRSLYRFFLLLCCYATLTTKCCLRLLWTLGLF